MRLLEPVHERLERFALAMTRNPEEARDLVAETLLRAYEHFDMLRDETAFIGYLFTTASRSHKRRIWRGRIFRRYDSDRAELIRDVGTSPDVGPDVGALYRALGRLPASQHEAVVLFEITGLSLEEIRAIQGGSLSGVKSRLVRGRKRLAELLGADEERFVRLPEQNERVRGRIDDINAHLLFEGVECHD